MIRGGGGNAREVGEGGAAPYGEVSGTVDEMAVASQGLAATHLAVCNENSLQTAQMRIIAVAHPQFMTISGFSHARWPMILTVRASNFYSIKDEQVLDLTVPAKTPIDSRYTTLEFDPSIRVAKVACLLGANASGKTTLLRAVSFVWNFVLNSFNRYEADDDIIISPFGGHGEDGSVSVVEIEFTPAEQWRTKHNFFKYRIEIRHGNPRNFVEREVLWAGKKRDRLKCLFDRVLKGDGYVINSHKDFDLPRSDSRSKARKNVSLISNLVQFEHKVAQDIYDNFSYSFISNVSIGKFNYDENFVVKYLKDRPHAVDDLKRFLRFIDVGINSFELMDINGETVPIFKHSGPYEITTLPYESQGTKNFFHLFPMLIASMKTGSTAIVDELDSDLHPFLVSEIIRWFQTNDESCAGSQLITALNHPSVLSRLTKEEVFLVEKHRNGSSRIIPAKDIQGIRRDTNLYKKYMSGSFGAVPAFG